MGFININAIIKIIIFAFTVIYIDFTLHIGCVTTSIKHKSTSQIRSSSKYPGYYNQPYYNPGFYNQQYTYNTPNLSQKFDTNNLTIEVLPNDDEDDDGYLKFGLLRDAYGYSDSLQRKKWQTGFLRASSNHGSVTLYLYELNEDTNSIGKLIDTFYIFNSDSYSLTGKEFNTCRNIIDVENIVGKEDTRPLEKSHRQYLKAYLPRLLSSNSNLSSSGRDQFTNTSFKTCTSTVTNLLSSPSTPTDNRSLSPIKNTKTPSLKKPSANYSSSSSYSNTDNENNDKSSNSDNEDVVVNKRSDFETAFSEPSQKKTLENLDLTSNNQSSYSPNLSVNINDIIKNVELMLEDD